MPSARYDAMVACIQQLREHLLPDPFDPTGAYPDDILTRALAFRVLAHAEIESYVEDRALDASRLAMKEFQAGLGVRRALLALVSFSGLEMESAPASLQAPQPTQQKAWSNKVELEEKLRAAANAFDHTVRHNHGIKEPNLLKLLLPVGIAHTDFDPVMLANINTFGELRGHAAHSSPTATRAKQPPDPLSEYNTVLGLIKDLAAVDLAIDNVSK